NGICRPSLKLAGGLRPLGVASCVFDPKSPIVEPTCTFHPLTFSLAMSVPSWTPAKSASVRVLQTTLPGTDPPKLMFPAVAVVPNERWPPTPRAQTPPLCWSCAGFGGEPMNAVDCDRNAVLAEWMEAARVPT